MNQTLETIGYSAVQPNTGLAAAAVAGDSLQMRNSRGRVSIVGWVGANSVSGFHRLIWNTGHDTTQNEKVNVNATEYDERICDGMPLQLQPQEIISAFIAGSNVAAAAEMGTLTLLYDDLPSSRLNAIDFATLQKRTIRQTTIFATLTGSAVAAGGWTGEELINAETNLLHANTDYAVMGISTSIDVPSVAMRGIFSGNMRIGVRGDAGDVDNTKDYFCKLSRFLGRPLIPVFNSGDANATYLSFLSNQAAVSPQVTVYLAELR